MPRSIKHAIVALTAILLPNAELPAQSFRRLGTEFNAKRPVEVPAGKAYRVIVAEFLHHGQINAAGTNMVVSAKNGEVVPSRVLQLGSGDFCRVAFEAIRGRSSYEIFYGGEPPRQPPPPWTNTDGLLLETRRYKHCDLSRLESVRQAFDAAEPYGSDYVENVHHARNPFSLKTGPFSSRYSGVLHVPGTGTYGFLTSSQDCSFLLIDDDLVVAAPGRHGAQRRVQPGMRKDVHLTGGPHKFAYYHAAAGANAMMAAFWEVFPTGAKTTPAVIPPDRFRATSIGHVPAGRVAGRRTNLVPDFKVEITGDVPLPDNALPLVAVRFSDGSLKAVTMQAKIRWDFGDGQTGDKPTVDHVYLRPGLYKVTFTVKRGTRSTAISNRIYVDRPYLTRKDAKDLHALDDYLPILKAYDPHTLDAASLHQLALAYEAKALAIEAGSEDQNRQPETPEQYLAAAVAAGKVAFAEPSAAASDYDLLRLARLIGPLARDRLAASQTAFDVWRGAARRVTAASVKAECEIEAADLAVNDLLDAPAAKELLDLAASHLPAAARPVAANLQRVWGDYYAATGDGESARRAYSEAERLFSSKRRYIERTAWRGAHSRSTEEFIRQGQYTRAAAQLRSWQREFPTEKIDGYLTLLFARYWASRGMCARAVAQSEQLRTVNPDSPCADRLLLLAAACELKLGRRDRALATLHSIVNDYPGSPLLPEVSKRIAELEAGGGGPQ